MILFPAIDLLDGRVVRLARGRRDAVTVYDDRPAERARSFAASGASWVHVVDLSAAFGEGEAERMRDLRAIEAICDVPGLKVDAGGGVRELADLERLLSLGCSRVALGTPLVKAPGFAREAVARHGGAVVADIAAAGDAVRVDGWREGASVSLEELLGRATGWGYRHLVFTDVDLDGTGSGIDAGRYRAVASAFGHPVVASGGVASAADLAALRALGDGVLEGVIVGRALYEGALAIAEALAIVEGRVADGFVADAPSGEGRA